MFRPVFIVVTYCLLHALFIYDTYPLFPSFWWMVGVLAGVSLSFLCCGWAFLATIVKGPGYAPYNWVNTRQTKYAWDVEMSNIAIYQQQVDFARRSVRPPRSSFSIDARRFVLRADHFCVWVQSWIGLKNHRQFMLMIFHAFVYAGACIGFRWWWYWDAVQSFRWWTVLGWMSCVINLFIMLFSMYHLSHATRNLARNVTIVEKYNKRKIEVIDKGCMQNCEEICGNRWCLLCWWIPCACCLEPKISGFYPELMYDETASYTEKDMTKA